MRNVRMPTWLRTKYTIAKKKNSGTAATSWLHRVCPPSYTTRQCPRQAPQKCPPVTPLFSLLAPLMAFCGLIVLLSHLQKINKNLKAVIVCFNILKKYINYKIRMLEFSMNVWFLTTSYCYAMHTYNYT